MASPHRPRAQGDRKKARPAGISQLLDNRRTDTLILGDVRAHVLARAAIPDDDRDQGVLHPSEICKDDWCPRAAYLNLRRGVAKQETPSFQLESIFEYGHDAHARWQRWLAQMGRLEGNWRCESCRGVFYARAPEHCQHCAGRYLTYQELPLRDIEGTMIAGRTDGFIPDREALIEVKTVGVGTVRMDNPKLLAAHTLDTDRGKVVDLNGLWDSIHRPFPSHLRQGQIYLYLAQAMGIKARKIAFIYDSKLTQGAKEFVVSFDPSLIAEILSSAAEVAAAIRGQGPAPACIRRDGVCTACLEAHGV